MKKVVLVFAVLAAVGLGLAVAGGIVLVQGWNAPLSSLEAREFEILRGESVVSIARRLANSSYIAHPISFEILVRLKGYAPRIQAGNYLIAPGDSLEDFARKIVSGDSIPNDVTVKFTEGMRVDQMGAVLEAAGLMSQGDFEAAAIMKESFQDLWALTALEPGDSLIGYLFPDTYRFRPGTEADQIIRRMVENLQTRLRALGITSPGFKSQQGLDLHEILTFASIVQQESPKNDMAIIAGVFHNRLKNGWRFESDATVNFILGTSKLIPTARDIRVQNPYNTYLIRGLPPGPIGNPGLEAIQATLSPELHSYFFFLHTPTGVTKPSRTFEEHLEYRRQYWE